MLFTVLIVYLPHCCLSGQSKTIIKRAIPREASEYIICLFMFALTFTHMMTFALVVYVTYMLCIPRARLLHWPPDVTWASFLNWGVDFLVKKTSKWKKGKRLQKIKILSMGPNTTGQQNLLNNDVQPQTFVLNTCRSWDNGCLTCSIPTLM